MKKRESILKKHPIIPSIFFLLFAWVLLYLITGFKDPETSNKLFNKNTVPELKVSNAKDGWDLEITKAQIQFTTDQDAKTFIYPYVDPKDATESSNRFLKVYQSSTEESDIKIIILKKGESTILDVIIEKDGDYFYSSGTL